MNNVIIENTNKTNRKNIKIKSANLYEAEMKNAKLDDEFIKRTTSSQNEFETSDLEIEKLISNEDF